MLIFVWSHIMYKVFIYRICEMSFMYHNNILVPFVHFLVKILFLVNETYTWPWILNTSACNHFCSNIFSFYLIILSFHQLLSIIKEYYTNNQRYFAKYCCWISILFNNCCQKSYLSCSKDNTLNIQFTSLFNRICHTCHSKLNPSDLCRCLWA